MFDRLAGALDNDRLARVILKVCPRDFVATVVKPVQISLVYVQILLAFTQNALASPRGRHRVNSPRKQEQAITSF